MPTYEYKCNQCDAVMEEYRTVSRRNDPMPCLSCEGGIAMRGIEVPERFHMGLPGQGQGVKYADGGGMSTKVRKPRRALSA